MHRDRVRVRERADYMGRPAIADSIRRVERKLEGHGRLLIRYSGTEPLLRIMLDQERARAQISQRDGAGKPNGSAGSKGPEELHRGACSFGSWSKGTRGADDQGAQ